ncbi:hypothetical protein BXZ70DRAFT_1027556 [Cristinia sonorae]|uniref:Uncharacterized protein n=1 Tax=Cristinia sonorae TaxID=1940300 RepID=A0A8K0UXX7_9AGAR|nr:hypothetical protein BXZ70DRAFT_1027556 [Cristinia sonorae]
MNLTRLSELPATLCLALGCRALAYVVALSQSLSSSCYTYFSRFCGLPPCGVFRVQDSAIVVIGGEGELGRTMALRFSELGYTVFTLHPTLQYMPMSESSSQTVDTSPATLLYQWHKKKEQSSRVWGLVAPIALDITSATDRKRASETVKAYCTSHSLQLVALISLAQPSFPSTYSDPVPEINASSSTTTPTQLKRRSTKDFSHALVWGDMVAQSIREPIVIFQDYIEMLARVSGRIIMVSTSSDPINSHHNLFTSAFDGIQRSISQYLAQQLNFHGIKLCTVSAGPLRHPLESQQSANASTIDQNSQHVSGTFSTILQSLGQYDNAHLPNSRLPKSSSPFTVTQEEVSQLLADVVSAE